MAPLPRRGRGYGGVTLLLPRSLVVPAARVERVGAPADRVDLRAVAGDVPDHGAPEVGRSGSTGRRRVVDVVHRRVRRAHVVVVQAVRLHQPRQPGAVRRVALAAREPVVRRLYSPGRELRGAAHAPAVVVHPLPGGGRVGRTDGGASALDRAGGAAGRAVGAVVVHLVHGPVRALGVGAYARHTLEEVD